jgi:peptidoglycan/xylan/chitin deacetylase (PgdA/CDA1 family)
MYHSVSAVGGPLRDLAVPPERLAEQLSALVDAGYRLVGLSEALDSPHLSEKKVVVTFDDGYRDFLTAGVPALQAAGAGATLYASVGHLGGGHARWLGEWAPAFGPMLTWSELAEVASIPGIEIGNHSLIHHPLDVLSQVELRDQVIRSHDELEQRLQLKVRSFAYPHGYNSRRVREVVAAAGHDNATEVGRRMHTPSERRLAVPRFQPTPDHTGADLVALVEGAGSSVVPQLKRLAQPGWRMVRKMARKAGRNLT